MKKIYIVLTYTGTILSKIIKVYTKNEFSHVSLSLDNKLEEMYSFGRLNAYNPFIGGFVHEHLDSGTFYRFKKTKTRILSITITDKQYEDIENIINKFKINKNQYKFNTIGLFAVALKLRLKFNKSYYCAEFVKYVLDEANIQTYLPEIIKPEDFKRINNSTEIYSGILLDFNKTINN